MNIAYIATVDPIKHLGVIKKIKTQTASWKELGHGVRVFFIVLKKNHVSQIHNETAYVRKNVIDCNREFWRDLKDFSPDLIYLRSELYKPFIHRLTKQYHTVLEINSDDYCELRRLAKTNYKYKIRFLFYILTRMIILRKISGIICVTYEISNLSYLKVIKNRIVIPNTIDINKFNVIDEKPENDKINIFFIGNLNQPWAGFDHIIQLASLTQDVLHIHIVGLTPSHSKKLNNITFHGFMNQEQYESIIRQCHIALGPLALYRKNMNEACPLIMREYLAFGLPVIIAHNDTAFINKTKPEWIFEIPNQENNIIEFLPEILKFCKKYKNYIISHQESEDYISNSSIESEKLKFLEQNVL